MSSIDERIVKMTFDNKDFEKGVESTIKSLDDLDKSLDLDGASKGLENVGKAAKNLDLSTITASVETVGSKFSAMEVVAISALNNITNKAINAGEAMLKSLTVDQISSGYDKYTEKVSSVQSLVNSTGEDIETVNGYLDKLMWFSDETSYSFTDMTSALATMSSSGGDVEKLIPLIEGVANATAFAGKGAEEFSRTMYNLNQSYSQGYLTAIDWKSIQMAGVASAQLEQTLIDAGLELGTIQDETAVTVENFAGTLSEAWATTEVMEAGFGKFAEMTEAAYELIQEGVYDNATEAYAAIADEFDDVAAKAAKSAQEAKTFKEAIDATKDAVSSGWMNTAEIIFGNYEEAKVLWTDLSEALYDFFAAPAESRNALLTDTMTSSWSKLKDEILDTGVSSERFENALLKAAAAENEYLPDIIENLGGIDAAFESNSISIVTKTNLIKEALGGLVGETELTEETCEELEEVARRVWRGDFGNGDERVEALTEAGYDYATVQEIVNQLINDGAVDWSKLTDEMLEAVGGSESENEALRELIESFDDAESYASSLMSSLNDMGGRDLLIDSFWNLADALAGVINVIKGAWRDIFPATTAEKLYGYIDSIHNFTESLKMSDETSDKLRRTLDGLFSILSMLKTTVTTVASKAFSLLQTVLGKTNISVLDITAKIGDAIVKFREWFESSNVVDKAFDKIVNAIKKVIKWVQSLIEKFEEIPQVQSVIESIKGVFSSLGDEIQNGFPTLTTYFSAISEWLKGLDGMSLSEIIQSFKDLWASLKGGDEGETALDDIKEIAQATATLAPNVARVMTASAYAVDEIENALSGEEGTLEDTGSFWDSLVALLKKIGQGISDVISSIDLGQVVAIAAVVATIVSIFSVGSAISKVGNAVKSLGSLFDSLNSTLKSFNKTQNVGYSSSWIDKVRSIVISLGILAIAVVELGKQDISSLAKGVIVIGILTAILAAVVILIEKVSGSSSLITTNTKTVNSLKGVGTMIIALGVSLLLIVTALKQMTKLMNEDDVEQSIDALIEILIFLGLAVVAIEKAAPAVTSGKSSLTKVATVVIAFAAAIKLLVSSLKDLTNINWTWGDVGALSVLMAALTAAVSALSHFTGGKLSLGSAATLIAFPLAIKLIISSFHDLDNLDYGTIIEGIPKLVVIFIELIALMKIVNKLDAGSGAGTLIAAATSVILIATAMKLLGTIDSDDMGKAIVAMAAIMAMLTIFTALANATSKTSSAGGKIKSGASSILAATAAIAVMALSMVVLAQVDGDKLSNAVVAITAMGLVFAAIEGMSALTGSGSTTTILSLAAVIAVLAIAVGALANLTNPEALSNATKCLTNLMEAFGVLELVIAVSNRISKPAEALGSLAELVLVIAALALVVGALANLTDPSSVMTVVDAMTKLMSGLSAMLIALAAIQMVGSLGGSGSLSGGMSIVGTLGTLVTVIGVIAAVLVALEALNEFAPGALEFLNSGAEKLGELIGNFIGGMVTGLVNAADLEGLAEQFTGFLEALVPALDSLSEMDDGVVDSMGTLAAAILKLCEAELVEAIAGFIEGKTSMTSFSVQLIAFGKGIAGFAEATEGINADSLDGAVQASEKLVDLEKSIPASDGLYQKLVGEHTWSSLSGGLVQYGLALSAFCAIVSSGNFESSNFEAAITASSSLAGILEEIPTDDGLLSKINGTHDWSTLGNGLSTYATALGGFADVIAQYSFESSNMTAAIDASSSLAGILGEIPVDDGLLSKVDGTHDWSTLGTGLKQYGNALAGFADTVADSNIGSPNVSAAIDASSTLADILEKVPTDDGLLSAIDGTHNWETLGSGLEDYGKALAGFGTAVGDIGEGDLTPALTATQSLADIQNELNKEGGILEWVTGSRQSFDEFGDGLASLGVGLCALTDPTITSQLENFDADVINQVITDLSGMQDELGKEGGLIQRVTGSKQSFEEFGSSLKALGEGLSALSDPTLTANLSNENIAQVSDAVEAYIGIQEQVKSNEKNNSKLTDFGNSLTTLGTGLTNVSSAVSGSTLLTDLTDLNTAVTDVIALSQAAADYKDLADLTILMNNFALVASQGIEAYMGVFNDSNEELSSVGGLLMSAIVDSITSMNESGMYDENLSSGADAIVEIIIDGLTNGVTNREEEIGEAMGDIVSLMSTTGTEGLTDTSSDWTDAGSALIQAFADGIDANEVLVWSSAAAAGQDGKNAVDAYYDSFVDSGKNLVNGLASGISDRTAVNSVYAAAANAAQAALDAVNAVLEINSPSRKTMQSGEYFDQGFINGMRNLINGVDSEASEVGDVALDAISRATYVIDSMLDDGLDFTPTITPVLDLSNVNAGVQEIGELMATPYDLSVDSARVNSLSSSMKEIQNRATNEDIVGAILGLGNTMSGSQRGNVYNVNGITYDDGTNISTAVKDLIRAANIERRA